jgi:CheY-like chemotaxis protein
MVLLVDDQADVRFMLSLYLEDEGLKFEEASSGDEALRRATAGDFELILLDQRMPSGLSGIEVAEALRSAGDHTPIVLYSAYLSPDIEDRATELGLRTVNKGEPDRLMEAVRLELAHELQ